MDSPIHDFYARRVKPLTSEEKLRLVELIARELLSQNGSSGAAPASDSELDAKRARFRRHAGAVSLGRPTGAENEGIDADLAREYGAGHEGD